MSNLLLLVFCLLAGFILRSFKVVPPDSHKIVNSLLVSIFLPAVTMQHISHLKFESRFILPVATAWIIFLGSFLFFYILSKFKKIDRKTLGCLILTAGISSTSFVGFPIFEMLYGKFGLEMGVLMSQAGSFLVCMTVGTMVACWFAAENPSFGFIFLNIVKFPPFIAFILALLINVFSIKIPTLATEILTKISAPFTTLALISVGLQIDFSAIKWSNTWLRWGLFYKLLVAPFIIYLLFVWFLGQNDVVSHLCVLGACIGSMNTISVIASRFGLNASLASQMVGVGIPLSLGLLLGLHYLL